MTASRKRWLSQFLGVQDCATQSESISGLLKTVPVGSVVLDTLQSNNVDARYFIFNRGSIPQDGRRGFDPRIRLPPSKTTQITYGNREIEARATFSCRVQQTCRFSFMESAFCSVQQDG